MNVGRRELVSSLIELLEKLKDTEKVVDELEKNDIITKEERDQFRNAKKELSSLLKEVADDPSMFEKTDFYERVIDLNNRIVNIVEKIVKKASPS